MWAIIVQPKCLHVELLNLLLGGGTSVLGLVAAVVCRIEDVGHALQALTFRFTVGAAKLALETVQPQSDSVSVANNRNGRRVTKRMTS